MSAKPETAFCGGVNVYLPPQLYRMKTHNPYISGPADFWYSGKKSDLWIEYKFIELPKRQSTKILPDLSANQIDWLSNRYDEGRNVRVIVGCKAGGVIYQDLEWLETLTTAQFSDRLQSRRDIAKMIEDFTMGRT